MRFCVSFEVTMTIKVMFAVLEAVFGRLRFVHLNRHDVVGQAISLYRAEQTDYWHSTQPQEPKQAAAYDFQEISERVDSLRNDDAAWRGLVPVRGHHAAVLFPTKNSTPSRCEPPGRSWSISGSQTAGHAMSRTEPENWRMRRHGSGEERFVNEKQRFRSYGGVMAGAGPGLLRGKILDGSPLFHNRISIDVGERCSTNPFELMARIRRARR